MTLPAPNLDDRTFEELLRDLQLLIPTYTPEWNDWNESDPGTTLLQLWAHVAETILYRLNRLPELAYVKFLELVGLRLRPARPATADLTFTPQPGFRPPPSGSGITVPAGTPVTAPPPAGGEPLTFETDVALDLVRAPLVSVQVADGGSFTDVSGLNGPDGSSFRPLGWVPQVGNALYLGFAPPDPPITGRVFPRAVRLRVFPPRDRTRVPGPVPGVTLVWEYRRGRDDPRWRRLQTFEDGTGALTRGGYLLVEGPREIDPVDRIGEVEEPRLWLRARLAAGTYPAGDPPEIDFVAPNTVPARNLATVRDEVVGISEGHPDQTFTLRHAPMQPESLVLEVEDAAVSGGRALTVWERHDDLLAAEPRTPGYTVDGASGVLTFGDGRRGRIPLAGARIVAREYRHGASAAGNVAAGAITTVATFVPGVQSVVNPLPAVGGADVQRIEELRRDAPAELRTQRRAVSAADHVALALQVGTVARATALPLAHPEHRNVDVPGSVTVVVVPEGPERAPQPSPELLDEVRSHLDTRRVIGTELHVVGPRYHEIKVVAEVEAEPYASFDTLALAIKGAVDAELDPLGRPAPPLPGQQPASEPKRGPGREFGRDLVPTSLYSVILGVAGAAAVPVLQVELDGAPWDDLGTSIVLDPDELLHGADDHEITVVPRRERTTRDRP